MNQKIVLPLLSSLGFHSIRRTYTSVLSTCNRDQYKAVSKKWNTIITEFENIENGISCGLMLGPLEQFFKNLSRVSRRPSEPDSALTSLLYNAITPLLSNPDGITALDNGYFNRMIRYEIRNKFRNPPAHTKYLHIEVAKECKKYVDLHLQKLFSWIR